MLHPQLLRTGKRKMNDGIILRHPIGATVLGCEVSLGIYLRNGFRILGLSPESQSQKVRRACDDIAVHLSAGIPEPHWRGEAAYPVSLCDEEIVNSARELTDRTKRFVHEFFCVQAPPGVEFPSSLRGDWSSATTRELLRNALPQERSWRTMHALAVACHSAAIACELRNLLLPEELYRVRKDGAGLWAEAFRAWGQVLSDPAAQKWWAKRAKQLNLGEKVGPACQKLFAEVRTAVLATALHLIERLAFRRKFHLAVPILKVVKGGTLPVGDEKQVTERLRNLPTFAVTCMEEVLERARNGQRDLRGLHTVFLACQQIPSEMCQAAQKSELKKMTDQLSVFLSGEVKTQERVDFSKCWFSPEQEADPDASIVVSVAPTRKGASSRLRGEKVSLLVPRSSAARDFHENGGPGGQSRAGGNPTKPSRLLWFITLPLMLTGCLLSLGGALLLGLSSAFWGLSLSSIAFPYLTPGTLEELPPGLKVTLVGAFGVLALIVMSFVWSAPKHRKKRFLPMLLCLLGVGAAAAVFFGESEVDSSLGGGLTLARESVGWLSARFAGFLSSSSGAEANNPDPRTGALLLGISGTLAAIFLIRFVAAIRHRRALEGVLGAPAARTKVLPLENLVRFPPLARLLKEGYNVVETDPVIEWAAAK
jgi:hypothetical protein